MYSDLGGRTCRLVSQCYWEPENKSEEALGLSSFVYPDNMNVILKTFNLGI